MPGIQFAHNRGVANCFIASDNTNKFFPLGNDLSSATESWQYCPATTAYDFTHFVLRVYTNGSNQTSTLYLRKNGVDGNNVLSVAATTTGVFYGSASDSFAVGDRINFRGIAPTGNGNSLAITAMGGYVEAVAPLMTLLLSPYITVTTSITRYFGTIAGSTEAWVNQVIPVAITVRNLSAYAISNTLNAAITVKSRKNAADGAASLSVTASTTGAFSDTSNTDSYAQSDTRNWSHTNAAGSGAATMRVMSESVADDGSVLVIAAYDSLMGGGTTRYVCFQGQHNANTTEAAEQTPVSCNGTVAKFTLYRAAYTNTASTLTVTNRINSADGACSISSGPNTSGVFSDYTHSNAVKIGDLLGYKYVTTSGSGNIEFIQNSCAFYPRAGPLQRQFNVSQSVNRAAVI